MPPCWVPEPGGGPPGSLGSRRPCAFSNLDGEDPGHVPAGGHRRLVVDAAGELAEVDRGEEGLRGRRPRSRASGRCCGRAPRRARRSGRRCRRTPTASGRPRSPRRGGSRRRRAAGPGRSPLPGPRARPRRPPVRLPTRVPRAVRHADLDLPALDVHASPRALGERAGRSRRRRRRPRCRARSRTGPPASPCWRRAGPRRGVAESPSAIVSPSSSGSVIVFIVTRNAVASRCGLDPHLDDVGGIAPVRRVLRVGVAAQQGVVRPAPLRCRHPRRRRHSPGGRTRRPGRRWSCRSRSGRPARCRCSAAEGRRPRGRGAGPGPRCRLPPPPTPGRLRTLRRPARSPGPRCRFA